MVFRNLRTKLIAGFLAVILVIALSIAGLGTTIIKKNIIGRAQQNIEFNLRTARTSYQDEIDRLAEGFQLIPPDAGLERPRNLMNLDFLYRLDREEALSSSDEIVLSALAERRGVGGTRIMSEQEIAGLDDVIRLRTVLQIQDTPRARPVHRARLETAMVKQYARPLLDEDGEVTAVLTGGRIINQAYDRVDRFRNMIFGDRTYNGKPQGTVTIFQDDVRIATNVLTREGYRAVGTRVSAEVYEAVVENGRTWHDRAFVVTDWYRTGYEPIRDLYGKVIGILYVGILEEPFSDLARKITMVFLAIVGGTTILALGLSLLLAGHIARPVAEMRAAARLIADGAFNHRVRTETGVSDFDGLAASFNEMTEKLDERETRLTQANLQMEEANRKYIDLIGFVSHELKGILASAIMNTYSIRDGYLGMINFKQRKAIDAIARTLDYLSATVKKFLNLGRIERGELPVNKQPIRLRRDIFEPALDSLTAQIEAKSMRVKNTIASDLTVEADPDLMQVAANNLVGNAIKYGNVNGAISIRSRQSDDRVEIEVYNDSSPIPEHQTGLLFKKFSRLDNESTRRVKGTGLGLFITRRIIESHGGSIRIEPRDKGNAFIFNIERN